MNKVKEQIERLQAEIDKLKILAEDKPKFEVGKWYKTDSRHGSIFLLTEIPEDHSCVKGYGFENGVLYDRRETAYWELIKSKNQRLATESEVLEALTKEAERRYPLGSKIKTLDGNKIPLEGYHLHIENGRLYASGKNIRSCDVLFDMDTCQWATIVEEEKIYIGENEVKFVCSGIHIGSCWYGLEHIKLLLPSNPSLFGKILKRMTNG